MKSCAPRLVLTHMEQVTRKWLIERVNPDLEACFIESMVALWLVSQISARIVWVPSLVKIVLYREASNVTLTVPLFPRVYKYKARKNILIGCCTVYLTTSYLTAFKPFCRFTKLLSDGRKFEK